MNKKWNKSSQSDACRVRSVVFGRFSNSPNHDSCRPYWNPTPPIRSTWWSTRSLTSSKSISKAWWVFWLEIHQREFLKSPPKNHVLTFPSLCYFVVCLFVCLLLKLKEYNESQQSVIVDASSIITSNDPKLFFLQGPPGTGKSHTIVGIINAMFYVVFI